MILAGPVKYFIAALVVLLLVAAGAAIMYRANYLVESQRRIEVEASLAQTVAAFDQYAKSAKAAMDAVTRAANTTRAITEDGRTQRDKAMKAPSEDDGPVAPVLRDALRVR